MRNYIKLFEEFKINENFSEDIAVDLAEDIKEWFTENNWEVLNINLGSELGGVKNDETGKKYHSFIDYIKKNPNEKACLITVSDVSLESGDWDKDLGWRIRIKLLGKYLAEALFLAKEETNQGNLKAITPYNTIVGSYYFNRGQEPGKNELVDVLIHGKSHISGMKYTQGVWGTPTYKIDATGKTETLPKASVTLSSPFGKEPQPVSNAVNGRIN